MPLKDLVALLPSQTRSSDYTSSPVECPQSAGLIVFLDITGVPGTPAGLSLRIQTQDPASGNWISLNAAPAAATAASTTSYVLHASASGGAVTQVTSLCVPGRFRIFVSHNADVGAYTYSVGYSTLNS